MATFLWTNVLPIFLEVILLVVVAGAAIAVPYFGTGMLLTRWRVPLDRMGVFHYMYEEIQFAVTACIAGPFLLALLIAGLSLLDPAPPCPEVLP